MTAEHEDEVRRLLADVGADPEPLPEHVGARLDDLLTDLVGERSRSTNVVPLTPRRRWPARLVAAAAVCVVVAGVGTVLTRNRGGEDSTAGSATAGTERAAGVPEAAGGQASAIPSPSRSFKDLQAARLPVLHPETMAGDLQRLARRSPAMTTGDNLGAVGSPPAASSPSLDCPTLTAHQRVSWIPAQLDGQLVAVLLGPVHAGERVARVYSCESRGAPLAVNPVAAP